MNDLDDIPWFLAAAGCLYVKANLCTPGRLPEQAEAWRRDEISLVHCRDQIRSHLAKNSGQYRNGSGDWGLSWVNDVVRNSWDRRRPPPRTSLVMTDGLNQRCDVDDSDDWPVDRLHRAPNEAQPTDPNPIEVGSGGENKDVSTHQAQMRPSQPFTPECAGRASDPAQPVLPINQAVAFLRRELADGEVEALIVKEKAKAEGIGMRTLDRARALLKVVSRRRGFGKNGQYWLALPTAGGD